MTAPELPPPELRERVLAAAAREPATPPGAWNRRVAMAGMASAAWLVASMALLGVRADWSQLPAGALTATLALLTVVASGASAVGLARGRLMVGAATPWLWAAAVGLGTTLVTLVLTVDAAGPAVVPLDPALAGARALRCFLVTTAVAVPLIACGVFVSRGLVQARPALAGTCLALGAATWAHGVVRVHCSVAGPVEGSEHALAGHLAPAIPLMVLGACLMWLADRQSWRWRRGRGS